MSSYERRVLAALAVLLIVLLSANLAIHFKRTVHLEIVSSERLNEN